MPNPSGEQHHLRLGPYQASVSEVGGGLRTLTFEGQPLVRGYGGGDVRPVYRGAVLAPWPNRIADGRYTWHGREHQLPLTEPARGNALHGLVTWLPWRLIGRSSSSLVLGCRIWPQDGYPYMIDLEVTYTLAEDGLHWSLRAANLGDVAAPYGCSIHPYLVAGPGSVDDWLLELDAAEYLEVDEVRLLPRRLSPVEGTPLDFRGGRPLKGLEVDHAFTGVRADHRGHCVANVRRSDGGGVQMLWNAACPWVQIHTADRPDPEQHRAGLAAEPMTCPPNAFKTGQDVVALQPGDVHTAWWRLSALTT